jgi:hypothetical protein
VKRLQLVVAEVLLCLLVLDQQIEMVHQEDQVAEVVTMVVLALVVLELLVKEIMVVMASKVAEAVAEAGKVILAMLLQVTLVE